LLRDAPRGRRALLHFVGGSRAERVASARHACRELGLDLHVLRGADVPSEPRAREELARVWTRENVLLGSALLIESEPSEAHGARLALAGFIDAAEGRLCLSGGDAPELKSACVLRVECRPPTRAEQRALWRDAFGSPLAGGAGLELGVERLVGQFSLSRELIEEVAAEARSAAPERAPEQAWNAVRRRIRPSFGTLARLIEPKASWERLVLPAAQKSVLRDIAVHVKQRQRVYDSWGFAERSSRGLGISALFAGPSGTGKTMAAEVLARQLELDLVHVDLSRVISKYIGETERNLSQIFDAAEAGSAILLFDEADALFGRRSEVKDAHDRYANIEVSYLLQRMEEYRGLALLTSNRENDLDVAFARRLRFVVRFPHPEPAERSEIWRHVFPTETPTDGLDHERLSRLELSGGNIRNIALHAAFLAAEEQSAVGMRHCASAARSELRKLGLTLPERELRGWE
ncbi:MAG TPA: ATP-binding protein, partial [Polyangiaceae bacterium]|nr:ATP-binding protein [Polyangiaceae bacterium]